jgi:sugar lactone lactonase YvrE
MIHRALTRLPLIAALVLPAAIAASQAGQQSQPQQRRQAPKINMATGYRHDPSWPQKPADAVWGAMASIVVDRDENIWTFNRGNVPVQVYRPDGSLVARWGEGQFKNPHHIRLDREGHVWTADDGMHVVRKWTREGKLLLTIGVPGETGEDETHFDRPTDMVVTPAGDVFVTDGYGNSRVVHFDKNGKFVKSWGKLGTAPGEFSLPHSIDIDSQGRLYVADRNNVRVQVFEQSGRFIAEWKDIVTPWMITILPGDQIWICGASPEHWGERSILGLPPKDQLVMRFTPDGRLHQLWTFPKGEDDKEKPGELNWVHGIGVDSRGSLYLGDINGKRAQKFIRLAPGQPATH